MMRDQSSNDMDLAGVAASVVHPHVNQPPNVHDDSRAGGDHARPRLTYQEENAQFREDDRERHLLTVAEMLLSEPPTPRANLPARELAARLVVCLLNPRGLP